MKFTIPISKNVKQMTIIKCGTVVKTRIGDIEAIITAATIRFDAVQYELSYVVGGDIKAAWMNECEFEKITDANKTNIGFNK